MNTRVTFRQRLRYRFDNFMARGTSAQIISLAVVTLVLCILFAVLFFVAGIHPKEQHSLPGWLFTTFTGLLKPKTPRWMPDALDYMVVQGVMLVCGMFVVSMLISILTSSFRSFVKGLQEGKSFIPVDDHTVILGWSQSLMSIISELVMAGESERRRHLVILADRNKRAMDEDLRKGIRDPKTNTIVTRKGNPMRAKDLEVVNLDGARAIIVLPPEEADAPDIEVVKTLMALVNNPKRQRRPFHIVTSIREERNILLARLASSGEAELIPSLEFISKLTAQTCRQAGLPVVYSELMGFSDNEIYVAAEPRLAGSTFGEALFAYRTSCVLGLRGADGQILLNPPSEHVIGEQDEFIFLAEDDSTIAYDPVELPAVDPSTYTGLAVEPMDTEQTVIIGWNRGAAVIVQELDRYIARDSQLRLLVSGDDDLAEAHQVAERCNNQQVTVVQGDTTDRADLDRLGVAEADHVIVLRLDDRDADASDASVLVTLIHVRDIIDQSGHEISVVSELVLEQNSQIAHGDRADDFVVGNYLVGLLYAQIAENKHLNRIFSDLLSEDGSEIYLKPAETYVACGQPLSFSTVVEAARRKGEVAFGYRSCAHQADAARNYGVKLNPDKLAEIVLEQGDCVIVLAEDYYNRAAVPVPGASRRREADA